MEAPKGIREGEDMGINGSTSVCFLRPSFRAANSCSVLFTRHRDFVVTCRAVEIFQLDSKVSFSFSTNLTSTHLLSSHNAPRPSRTQWLDPHCVIPTALVHAVPFAFYLATHNPLLKRARTFHSFPCPARQHPSITSTLLASLSSYITFMALMYPALSFLYSR